MLTLETPEALVPKNHPLRKIEETRGKVCVPPMDISTFTVITLKPAN